jgi:hypothetical protein
MKHYNGRTKAQYNPSINAMKCKGELDDHYILVNEAKSYNPPNPIFHGQEHET